MGAFFFSHYNFVFLRLCAEHAGWAEAGLGGGKLLQRDGLGHVRELGLDLEVRRLVLVVGAAARQVAQQVKRKHAVGLRVLDRDVLRRGLGARTVRERVGQRPRLTALGQKRRRARVPGAIFFFLKK